MAHRGKTPQTDEDDEAFLDADAVDDPTREHHPDGVGELEAEDDTGVGAFIPSELLLERALEQADDLPVDVVDGRGEEEECADNPALVADFSEGFGHGEGMGKA